jgi:hypothetical protein
MAEQEPKLDPFKPAQPLIPGVPKAGASASGSAGGLQELFRQPQILLGTLGVLAFLIGGSVWWWSRASAKSTSDSDSARANLSTAATPASAPPPTVPVGPGVIGTTDEVSKIWSSKRFDFTDPDTKLVFPAMVVHLPRGGYWGFSLREPFGGCRLEYVTDLARLKNYYGVESDHPMVGDPCDASVFDLLKYGPTRDNVVVRGAIVHGTALRPPIAIEIKIDGNRIVAARRE